MRGELWLKGLTGAAAGAGSAAAGTKQGEKLAADPAVVVAAAGASTPLTYGEKRVVWNEEEEAPEAEEACCALEEAETRGRARRTQAPSAVKRVAGRGRAAPARWPAAHRGRRLHRPWRARNNIWNREPQYRSRVFSTYRFGTGTYWYVPSAGKGNV
jgi:hypothetical protein